MISTLYELIYNVICRVFTCKQSDPQGLVLLAYGIVFVLDALSLVFYFESELIIIVHKGSFKDISKLHGCCLTLCRFGVLCSCSSILTCVFSNHRLVCLANMNLGNTFANGYPHADSHSNEMCVTNVCFEKSECKQMEIYKLSELHRQKIFI